MGSIDSLRWTRVRTLTGSALLGVTIGACLLFGYWLVFSNFNEWDDEGYFLLALRAFQAQGGLYEQIRDVFYGPFYFESIGWGSGLLHIPLDSASARWLVLAGWAAGFAASGLATWRLTRSPFAACVAVAFASPVVLLVSNEPLHANSLILLLLPVLLLLCSHKTTEAAPSSATMVVCGALCAAIGLVKLNMGVFLLLALACAFPPGGTGRAGVLVRWLLALALLALPFVLMQALLSSEWVQNYALQASIALLPFAVLLLRPGEHPIGRRQTLAFLAAGALLALLSIGACLANGTTLAGMWRSLVVDALAFPLKNGGPPDLPGRAQILIGLLGLPVGLALRRRALPRTLLQLGIGAWVLYDGLFLRLTFDQLPFLWFLTLDAGGSPRRFFPGVLTVLFALQAFPIPGCQLACYALLLPLVAVCGISDAWNSLDWKPARTRLAREVLAPLAAVVALLLLFTRNPFWQEWSDDRERWSHDVELDLPGCAGLRLPELDVAQLDWLAANLHSNADTFVGFPGAPSLHLWSGVPQPVPFCAHHWVSFYELTREEELTRKLLAARRPCIVRNESMVSFWLGGKAFHDGPFRKTLREDFQRVGVAGHRELWIPRTATPDLVLSAVPAGPGKELLERFGAARSFLLRFPQDCGSRVARLTLSDAERSVDLLDSAAPSAGQRLTVLSPEGDELLRAAPAQPIDASRSRELLVLFPPLQLQSGAKVLLIRAYDETGRVVARFLFQTKPSSPPAPAAGK